MRIHQLFESQRSQIERLHRNSQIFLYYPTDLRGILTILKDKSIREENAFVAPDIHNASKFGRMVIGFFSQGKHLSPPPSMTNQKDLETAKQNFPDSTLPLVSLALTAKVWPHAFYSGPLSISQNIASYHMVGYDRKAEKIDTSAISTFANVEELTRVLIKISAEHKRRKGGEQSWKQKRTN